MVDAKSSQITLNPLFNRKDKMKKEAIDEIFFFCFFGKVLN